MMLSPIAQAVVTDPGGGSAGYALVAASPSLEAQDAELLERSPGVSEYLHTKENPRPCFSFFSLPSGAWALSRRFASGTRRGQFNRIVAHTLVLQDDILQALAEEPSLLTSHCRYQLIGHEPGALLEFFQLSKLAAEPQVSQLADLSCQPPDDLGKVLIELTAQRRKFLLRSFDEATLEERLAALFSALAGGRHLLLPQEPAYEELLRLGWSSLPPADRREVPWTTHFAPGVRVTFRLLNAPNPQRAREQQAHPEQWWLADQPAPAAQPGAVALASAVARDQPSMSLRLADLGKWPEQLRLFGGGEALESWLAWISHWSRQIEQGCDSLDELRGFYRQVSRESKLYPWIQPASVLRCTIRSIARLVPAESGRYRPTIDAVYSALEQHGLAETVLEPATLQTLSSGSFGRLEALAAALALRAQLPPPRGRTEREAVYDALLAERGIEGGRVVRVVLLDLAFELVGCHSEAGRQILTRLLAGPRATADEVCARLNALPEPLPVAAVLVETLRQTGGDWPAMASDLLAVFLVPQLSTHDALRSQFEPELLAWILHAASAEGLGAALKGWRGEPLDLAIDQLRSRLAERPELARRTVESFAANEHLEVSGRLAGISLHLAKAGLSAVHWMPFAVAEAAWFDGGQGAREMAEKHFLPLASVELTDEEAAACFQPVLAALTDHIDLAGRCHRVLFDRVVAACLRYPEAMIQGFRRLFEGASQGFKAGAELLGWEPTIRRAREVLASHRHDQHASQLVALWWKALAGIDEIPAELAPTLDWILPNHRRGVVRAWLGRIEELAEKPQGRPLAKALRSLTRGDENLTRAFEQASLRGEINPQSQDLVVQLNELHQQCGGDELALQELLDSRALPPDDLQRGLAVLELLTSSETLWQTIYKVLEVDFLVPAVEEVLERRPKWLMDVGRLTAREQVLVRVAKKLGQTAHKDLARPIEFLDWALDAPWPSESAGARFTGPRDMFLATLLSSSEIARERSWDLIDGLFEQRQIELLNRLRQLASSSKNPYLRSLEDNLKAKVSHLRGVAVG